MQAWCSTQMICRKLGISCSSPYGKQHQQRNTHIKGPRCGNQSKERKREGKMYMASTEKVGFLLSSMQRLQWASRSTWVMSLPHIGQSTHSADTVAGVATLDVAPTRGSLASLGLVCSFEDTVCSFEDTVCSFEDVVLHMSSFFW